MLAPYMPVILIVTGVVTALPVLVFVAPARALRLLFKLDLRDEAGLMFAQHWGLLAATMGGLLIYAAGDPEVRAVIVLAAMLEKAGLVGCIAAGWKKPHTRGLRLVFAFDLACTALYAAWLLGA